MHATIPHIFVYIDWHNYLLARTFHIEKGSTKDEEIPSIVFFLRASNVIQTSIVLTHDGHHIYHHQGHGVKELIILFSIISNEHEKWLFLLVSIQGEIH